jgi:hypothetical protein
MKSSEAAATTGAAADALAAQAAACYEVRGNQIMNFW